MKTKTIARNSDNRGCSEHNCEPRSADRAQSLLSMNDTRPDPVVLTQDERMSEFGRLFLRAVERITAKRTHLQTDCTT